MLAGLSGFVAPFASIDSALRTRSAGALMSVPVRLVIAGFGLVGKRHAAAIRLVEDVELAGIIDPSDAARAEAQAAGIPWFGSFNEMFAHETPSGIIIATPTPLHVEQGLECLEKGCPLLVEKPLATSAADGAVLVEAARNAAVPILVGHHRRHNPIIRKAREIIDRGAIGEIRAFHANCWFYKPDHYFDEAPWRKLKGAGPVSVNLVHDVDLMRYFGGEVINVRQAAGVSIPARF